MMRMNRWDPFAEIGRLQDQLMRWGGAEMPARSAFTPAVDIYEEKDAIFVKAELPGVKPEDVHIQIENNLLTIRGERKLENEDKREGYHRIEGSYGPFSRSFSLPSTVDTERVEAEMNNGVLTVRIPKKAVPEPKRIQVKSAAQPTRRPVEGRPAPSA